MEMILIHFEDELITNGQGTHRTIVDGDHGRTACSWKERKKEGNRLETDKFHSTNRIRMSTIDTNLLSFRLSARLDVQRLHCCSNEKEARAGIYLCDVHVMRRLTVVVHCYD